MSAPSTSYKRILLKLSGEALMGSQEFGIGPDMIRYVAEEIRSITAPSVSETTLLTATGVEITVGEAVHMQEKSVIVSDILAAEGAKVVFIDVRSIERPISRGLGE